MLWTLGMQNLNSFLDQGPKLLFGILKTKPLSQLLAPGAPFSVAASVKWQFPDNVLYGGKKVEKKERNRPLFAGDTCVLQLLTYDRLTFLFLLNNVWMAAGRLGDIL